MMGFVKRFIGPMCLKRGHPPPDIQAIFAIGDCEMLAKSIGAVYPQREKRSI
jgi:hypothetical protein